MTVVTVRGDRCHIVFSKQKEEEEDYSLGEINAALKGIRQERL